MIFGGVTEELLQLNEATLWSGGPSGAGKGTLIKALAERVPVLEVAISATTRRLNVPGVSRMGHATAAVLAALGILRRTSETNATLEGFFDPITMHVGVNSGIAAVGAITDGWIPPTINYTTPDPA